MTTENTNTEQIADVAFDAEINSIAEQLTTPKEETTEQEVSDGLQEEDNEQRQEEEIADGEEQEEQTGEPEQEEGVQAQSEDKPISAKFAERIRYERQLREEQSKRQELENKLKSFEEQQRQARFDIAEFNQDPAAMLEKMGIDPMHLIDRLASDKPIQELSRIKEKSEIEKRLQEYEERQKQFLEELQQREMAKQGQAYIDNIEGVLKDEKYDAVNTYYELFPEVDKHRDIVNIYTYYHENGETLTEKELAAIMNSEAEKRLNDLKASPALRRLLGQSLEGSETVKTNKQVGKSKTIGKASSSPSSIPDLESMSFEEAEQALIDMF